MHCILYFKEAGFNLNKITKHPQTFSDITLQGYMKRFH
jgi:hypothetical protein